jgi:hypothetical protein
MIITVDRLGGGRYRARLDSRVLVRASHTPLLAAARVLLDEGVDPSAPLVMRHAGRDYDALTSTVGTAAKLTVRESPKLKFDTWKPWCEIDAVSSPMHQTDEAA